MQIDDVKYKKALEDLHDALSQLEAAATPAGTAQTFGPGTVLRVTPQAITPMVPGAKLELWEDAPSAAGGVAKDIFTFDSATMGQHPELKAGFHGTLLVVRGGALYAADKLVNVLPG